MTSQDISKMSRSNLEDTIKLAQEKLAAIKGFYTEDNMNYLYSLLTILTEHKHKGKYSNVRIIFFVALWKAALPYFKESKNLKILQDFNLVSQNTLNILKEFDTHNKIMYAEGDVKTDALELSAYVTENLMNDLLQNYTTSSRYKSDCSNEMIDLVKHITDELKIKTAEEDEYVKLDEKWKVFSNYINNTFYSNTQTTLTRDEFFKSKEVEATKVLCEYIIETSKLYNKYLSIHSIRDFNNDLILNHKWKLLERVRIISSYIFMSYPKALPVYIQHFDPSLSYDESVKVNSLLRNFVVNKSSLANVLLEDKRVVDKLFNPNIHNSITIDEIISTITKKIDECNREIVSMTKDSTGSYTSYSVTDITNSLNSLCESKDENDKLLKFVVDLYVTQRKEKLKKK